MLRYLKIKLLVDLAVSYAQGISLLLLPAASLKVRDQFPGSFQNWGWSLIFLPGILFAIAATRTFPFLVHRFKDAAVYRVGVISTAAFFVLIHVCSQLSGMTAFYGYLAATAVQGVGFALITASINYRVPSHFPDHIGAGMAGVHAFFCLGALSAPLGVDLFRRFDEWQNICWFPAFGLFAAVPLITSLIRDCRMEESRSYTPGEIKVYALIFLYGISEAAVGNWAAVYIADVKQLDAAVTAVSLSAFWVMMAAGRLAGSWLVCRFSQFRIQATHAALAVFGAFWILTSADAAQCVLAYAVTGFGCSVFFPLTTALAAKSVGKMDAVVSSTSVTALLLGIGVSGPVAGFLMHVTGMTSRIIFVISALLFSVIAVGIGLLSFQAEDKLE